MLRRLVLFLCLIIPFACKKDSGTETPSGSLGKRDYLWSVDTLWIPGAHQIVGRDIWGATSSNVWVSAWSGINAGSLWHYDGTNWTNMASPADANDGRGSVDLAAVYGLSTSSVWFAGSRLRSRGAGQTEIVGFIMEWNGSAFVEHTDSLITHGRELIGVWGKDRNTILAVGLGGQALHFNGVRWRKIGVEDTVWFNSVWGINATKIFFLGYQFDHVQPFDTTLYSVLHFDGNNIQKVASYLHLVGSENWTWGVFSLWTDGTTMYSSGNGIFRLTGATWQRHLNAEFVLRKIRGSAPNNILAVGNRNSIYHFNGVNWMKLSPINNETVNWSSACACGNEIFIVGELSSKTLILIGR